MALPSTDNLKCLGALYGVPVDYLINEATERPVSEGDNKEIEDQQRRKRLLRGIPDTSAEALRISASEP